jgi:tetratricopeptide (TPR) repeat protein
MKLTIGICLFIVIALVSCGNPEKENRSDVSPDKKGKQKDLELKAIMLYDQENYADAVKYFDSLINLDPINGKYYYGRAFSYGMLIQKTKAIEDYKKAIKYNYKVNHSYYNIGINYMYVNDSLAVYYFKKCLMIDPGYVNAAVEISDCNRRLKNSKN